MKIKAEVFVPKFISPKRLRVAVENAMEGAAKDVQIDYRVTSQTWQNKPVFGIDRPSWFSRDVFTTDFIYGLVDTGTKPHIIVARNAKMLCFAPGSQPKTTPRVIGSQAGSRGSGVVYTPKVKHPGTTAREFSQEISEKWQRLLPGILQRAIDSLVIVR